MKRYRLQPQIFRGYATGEFHISQIEAANATRAGDRKKYDGLMRGIALTAALWCGIAVLAISTFSTG